MRRPWRRSGRSPSGTSTGRRTRTPTAASPVGPHLCLLEVPEPKTVKNRMHFDLVVSGEGSPDQQWQRVTDEVERLRALGASVLAECSGHHILIADPEGNEFCVT